MKADLHVHSHHSGDSRQTLQEIFAVCREQCLGAVAVVDHNSLRGAREAMASAPKDIIVVPGMEITSAEGHILAYNISEEVPRDLSAGETVDLVRMQGGIAVAAHPYRIWSGLGERATRQIRFDAVEAFNGRNTAYGNRRASRLAEELGLPTTAGSDAHRPGLVGSAFLVFADDCGDADSIIGAILSKKVKVGGRGRGAGQTLAYGARSIGMWARRGFRRL